MAKLTLSDVTNPNNTTSLVATINANSDAIETALENTLSRDGTEPNEMDAELDMNSNRIINLPEPLTSTEPVRLADIDGLTNGTFNLDDLLDVTVTSLADNDFLRYDLATEQWVNEAAAGAGTASDSEDYLVKTASAGLSAERVVTDSTSVVANWDTAGQVEFRRAALTGDVTATANSNATTIADEAVTFAKMQHVATNSLLGRDTAGTGDVENILLDDTLSMDGSGNLQRAALVGDVTASAGSNTTVISAGAVDLAMMQDIATERILGRASSGTGAVEQITAPGLLEWGSISDLGDVNLVGTTSGDVLQYDGVDWVNSPVGSFGAPSSAEYIVSSANAGLSAERVVTNTATVEWDAGTAAQLKANVPDASITYAKMQDVSAADRLLGRGNGGGSGDVQEITLGTGLSMSTTTLNVTSPGTGTFPVTFCIACSDETTALTAGTAKVTFRMPHAMTVTAVRASLTTAQATDGAGGIFTVDINEGAGAGTSILGTKLTIDNTELTSTTALTAATITDSSLADDAQITIDIDQIGDGTAAGLKVYLIGTRTA